MQNIIIPMDSNKEKSKPSYDDMVDVICPYTAMGDRVIAIQIDNEDVKKKKSSIYIPDHVKKSMEEAENFIVPAIVKSVGSAHNESNYDLSALLEVNDVIYTYPGAYEAKLTVGGIEYMIFSRRDVLMKIK